MSAPERIWANFSLATKSKAEVACFFHTASAGDVAYLRADLLRAELAQVHDLYASLARQGAPSRLIGETAERAAEALRVKPKEAP